MHPTVMGLHRAPFFLHKAPLRSPVATLRCPVEVCCRLIHVQVFGAQAVAATDFLRRGLRYGCPCKPRCMPSKGGPQRSGDLRTEHMRRQPEPRLVSRAGTRYRSVPIARCRSGDRFAARTVGATSVTRFVIWPARSPWGGLAKRNPPAASRTAQYASLLRPAAIVLSLPRGEHRK
jgi:hypothetical protein